MITQKKTANAVGGKTARACESCLKKRASWFCPADDAFLCNACDSSVHSANELAGRHKRVRLETASSSKANTAVSCWHQGFTKKARTPRNVKAKSSYGCQMPVVPEVSNDDNEGCIEENEENELVFSVPTFDPFETRDVNDDENDIDGFNISLIGFEGDEWDNLPSENELAEFAADVEHLLEHEHEAEAVKLEEEEEEEDVVVHEESKNNFQVCFPGVKVEDEGESITNDHCYLDWSIGVESEMLNFDSQVSGGEEEEEKKVVNEESKDMMNMQVKKRRKILLRLNYEEIINAWASLGCSSPWTTGRRPEFHLDHDGWPYAMGGMSPKGVNRQGEEWMIGGGVRSCHVKGGDEGREARVSRYREKRRTRLFSKKIRYQVRKLNAEKRPRLKGRFVKRTSLPPFIQQ